MGDVLLLDAPATAEIAPVLSAASGWSVEHVAGRVELLALLPAGWAMVVVPADLGVVRAVRAADATVPIVAVTPHADVDLAARAVAAGASDLLVVGDRLGDRVATLLGKVGPWVRLSERERRQLERERERFALMGDAPQMRELRDRVRRVARVPRPVLVLGERGTGKELVARAIHDAAGPPGRPLVCVNCAAFPDALLETELFGHERGAYTGADRRAAGRFEQADGGTLFLDEVACMSLPFQQKVLRTVEYGTFTRVGGTQEGTTSARIVAATNADLGARILARTFLPDLYDRLAFEVIRVPSLRERTGDVDVLARHFLGAFQKEIPSLRGRHLTEDALDALRAYPWPGNVRELKHVVERAAYREGADAIGAADLGLAMAEPDASLGFEAKVEAYKRSLLHEALATSGGNGAQAARALGLTYDQLRYYLKKLP